MKVYICQCDLLWCDKEGNRAHIEELLSKAAGGSVVGAKGIAAGGVIVLPEMFSTGFVTEPKGVAETDCASLEWMKKIANEYGCAIAGSVATEESTHYYNRFYFVNPDGNFAQYDKRHLFTYGREDKRFTAGKDRTITEYAGARFLLQVCYDLRFPCYSRNMLPNPYDVAIYVASWPSVRIGAWDTLLKARAIENQCYIIGVNRVGDDPSCKYNGHSVVIDPYGNVAAECEDGWEGIACADLDMTSLQAFRGKFPVLKDADQSHCELDK
jgi:predicted amidohydrolase